MGARVMGRGAGGHADYIVVPTRALWGMPDALTYPAAAALPNVVVTAHDALVTNAALTAGESVDHHRGFLGRGHGRHPDCPASGCDARHRHHSLAWQSRRPAGLRRQRRDRHHRAHLASGRPGAARAGVDVVMDQVGGRLFPGLL